MLFLIQVQEKKFTCTTHIEGTKKMGLDSFSLPPFIPSPLKKKKKKKKNLVKGRNYASEKKNTRRRPSAFTLESWEVENEKAIGLSFTATMPFYARD